MTNKTRLKIIVGLIPHMLVSTFVRGEEKARKETEKKDAGKVGLWTKADSVIHFDDLTIEKAEARGELNDKPGKAREIKDEDDDDDKK